jgi:Domain of unknown function (DUF4388)
VKGLVQNEDASTTLEGTLEEITLYELLQLFEMLGNEGILHVHSSGGRGTLSFMDRAIMDAHWNTLQGEDALLKMLDLKEGIFALKPGHIQPGSIMKPIGYVVIETARLLDELLTVEEYVPQHDSHLTLNTISLDRLDESAHLILRSIQEGFTQFSELRARLSTSDTRLKLSIARLIAGGYITETKHKITNYSLEENSSMVRTIPCKILMAFTDPRALSQCMFFLNKVNKRDTPSMNKSRFSDFYRMSVSSQLYDFYFFRGETRFSFMWEPILKTSGGALFILMTGKDTEYADFFIKTARRFCVPCMGVSFNEDCGTRGTQVITTSHQLEHIIKGLKGGSSSSEDNA